MAIWYCLCKSFGCDIQEHPDVEDLMLLHNDAPYLKMKVNARVFELFLSLFSLSTGSRLKRCLVALQLAGVAVNIFFAKSVLRSVTTDLDFSDDRILKSMDYLSVVRYVPSFITLVYLSCHSLTS